MRGGGKTRGEPRRCESEPAALLYPIEVHDEIDRSLGNPCTAQTYTRITHEIIARSIASVCACM